MKTKTRFHKLTAWLLTLAMLMTLLPGFTLSASAAEVTCVCGTDDPAIHATNCPAYVAPEDPVCFCAEQCTEGHVNVWCDVCGTQGASACRGTGAAAVLADEPVEVDASTPVVYAGGVELVPDTYYLTVGGVPTPDGAGASSYNLHLVADGAGEFTLELKNATIGGAEIAVGERSAEVCGIFAAGPLTLQLTGKNYIEIGDYSDGDSSGLWVHETGSGLPGDLTIQGSGSLDITVGTCKYSYGIWAGSLTLESGDVSVSTGAVGTKCIATGVGTDELLIVNGGTLHVKCADSTAEETKSYGIDSHGSILVTGGTVTATGGAGEYSYGISAKTSFTLENGTVEATGGTVSEGGKSYGVNVTGNLTVTGEGLLTASGSKSANESCGIYATNDVVIESGEITATGKNYGISANSVQMEDGSLTATGESTGIFCAVTIYGGTITATGADCGISDGVMSMGGAVTAKGTSAEGYGIIGPTIIIDGAMTATGGHSAFMFEEDSFPMLMMATPLIKAGASETDAAEITLEALESSYQHGTESYDGYVYTTHKYFSIAKNDNYYPITVGGVVVSKENMKDVLGDGGSVSYDPSTNTLTLNNATITGIENDTASMGTGISAMSDLKLKLVGENTVTGQQAMAQGMIPMVGAIVVYGDLTISGGGKMQVQATDVDEDGEGFGIEATTITIESGEVTANGKSEGIFFNSSFEITGGTVTATGEENGIYSIDGDITVKGGSLTATATGTDGTALYSGVTFSFEDGYTSLVYVGDSAENTAPWDEETYLKNYRYVRIYPQDSDLLEVTYTDGVEDEEIFADVTYNKLVKGVGTPAFGDANPTRAGYTFTGWSPEVADTVTKNEIYTAQWTVNQYTITFDVNGGIVAPASAIVTIPTAGTYTLVFADYEESRLNNIDIVTFTVTEDKVGAITVPIENGITLGTGDKIMLWNNMTDLVPLCEAYIVE